MLIYTTFSFCCIATGEGLNTEELSNLVRNTELLYSEFQLLIILVNKQHEALTVFDEWSEVTKIF